MARAVGAPLGLVHVNLPVLRTAFGAEPDVSAPWLEAVARWRASKAPYSRYAPTPPPWCVGSAGR